MNLCQLYGTDFKASNSGMKDDFLHPEFVRLHESYVFEYLTSFHVPGKQKYLYTILYFLLPIYTLSSDDCCPSIGRPVAPRIIVLGETGVGKSTIANR